MPGSQTKIIQGMPGYGTIPNTELHHRVDALERDLNQRTLVPSPRNRAFIEKTNRLKQALTGGQSDVLLEGLVKSLNKHCEPLLPMATGKYQSHGNVTFVPIIVPGHGHLSFELGHEGGHVAGHGMHYLLHQLEHIHIIEIAQAFLSAIPLIAGVACCAMKLFSVWKEHQLIKGLKKQLAKLNDYSGTQREVLYEYVMLKVLYTLKTELCVTPDIAKWHFLILSQSLASLSQISAQFDSLEALGEAWSEDIIRQFRTYGVYMPTEVIKYQARDLSIAHQVQRVFMPGTAEYKKSQEEAYQKLKKDLVFESMLTKGLRAVLEAYAHRVAVPKYLSVIFRWYSPSEIETLRVYFGQFNYALELIANNMTALKQPGNNQLQLQLIENCLKGQLDKMAAEMAYSREVATLSAQTSSARILSIPEPISTGAPGELIIQDPLLLSELTIRGLQQRIVDLNAKLALSEEVIISLEKQTKCLKDKSTVQENTIAELRKPLDPEEQYKAFVQFQERYQASTAPRQGDRFFDGRPPNTGGSTHRNTFET